MSASLQRAPSGIESAMRSQSRKDVEGSLFLVRRLSQPRFQLVILNKKSAGNASLLLLARAM